MTKFKVTRGLREFITGIPLTLYLYFLKKNVFYVTDVKPTCKMNASTHMCFIHILHTVVILLTQ